MNKRLDINKILILEAVVWFSILCMFLVAVRVYHYKQHKETKQYQIFISDVDGLIVGSPVKYMGVQVGYVSYAKLLSNEVYIKFVLKDKDFELPKGVVANVEFNGLGGTKSLELYPPSEQDVKTQKIINIKETFRLAHSVDLLDNMFSKMALIGGKFSYFLKQVMPFIEFEETETYAEFTENLDRVNRNMEKLPAVKKEH